MAFIGNNRTRYSTEDLEVICDRFFQEAKVTKPCDMGGLGHGITCQSWAFKFVAEELPVEVLYWSGAKVRTVEEMVRRVKTGRNTSPYSAGLPGPWFIRGEKGSRRGAYSLKLSGNGSLCVLSPGMLAKHVGDLEALAMSGSDSVLPPEVTAQLMLVLIGRSGLTLCQMSRAGNVMLTSGAVPELYDIIQAWVKKSDLSVRICKNVQNPKVKLTTAESIRRLLGTYLSGGAANGMMWKRWTIKDKVSEHYHFWLQTEAQKKRLIDKGGVATREHQSTGDMLRDMAAEYDKRAAEWAKKQEGK